MAVAEGTGRCTSRVFCAGPSVATHHQSHCTSWLSPGCLCLHESHDPRDSDFCTHQENHSARLSFRFDGEIKSFPDKQKLRECSTHIPALTNAKETSLGRKYKKTKRLTENKPKTIKKMVTGLYITKMTLNVNGLNTPAKRHRLGG